MKTFRTLDLAIEFHKAIEKVEVTGHLKEQLFRAATSIPLNLSEGNARPTSKDKKRSYHTAYASLKECQTILKLLPKSDEEIDDMADKIGAYLYNLIKSHNPDTGLRYPRIPGLKNGCGGRI